MSEAKEGKLLGRKKLLDPHLGTTEGTKITSTIIFYTSHALTVYSNAQPVEKDFLKVPTCTNTQKPCMK